MEIGSGAEIHPHLEIRDVVVQPIARGEAGSIIERHERRPHIDAVKRLIRTFPQVCVAEHHVDPVREPIPEPEAEPGLESMLGVERSPRQRNPGTRYDAGDRRIGAWAKEKKFTETDEGRRPLPRAPLPAGARPRRIGCGILGRGRLGGIAPYHLACGGPWRRRRRMPGAAAEQFILPRRALLQLANLLLLLLDHLLLLQQHPVQILDGRRRLRLRGVGDE